MNFYKYAAGLALILSTAIACQKNSKNGQNTEGGQKPVFAKVSSDQTGIKFINTVTNTKDFNILTYRNFYNGGGVAIGDINNDGLADVYMTANMSDNKLYLNKGNLKFEDISTQSGVGRTRGFAPTWSTGAVMVDINNDGFLDIYVCNAGYTEGVKPYNQLYINNKDLTFTERAKEYGLDDDGYTTHAAFFDYDGDGDLDCYILNNSFIPVNTLNFANNRSMRAKDWPVADFLKGGGDKLLENKNGKFTDVSEKTGIFGSLIGFGLGVTVGDVNSDGWLDIYVSNDFFERDYLYINNGNGTFKEDGTDAMQHFSTASMGSDMADVNNDGKPDIFATEMLPYDEERLKSTTDFETFDIHRLKKERGFHDQFSQNTLQINQGDGTFKDVAHYSGVASSDWSWGALIFDADYDGNQDLLVCNGIYHDVIDQDFIEFFADELMQKMAMTGKKEEVDQVINRMPSVPIQNLMFKNKGNLAFEEVSTNWGLTDKTFSNGAAYGDLDNDGDLDLVINNVNQEALVYQNNTVQQDSSAQFIGFLLRGSDLNTFAVGSKIQVFAAGQIFQKEVMPSRGFQSSVDYKTMIGLPKKGTPIDSVKIFWHDKTETKLAAQNIDFKLNTLNTIDYKKVKRTKTQFYPPSVKPLFLAEKNTFDQNFDAHKEDTQVDFYAEKTVPMQLSQEGPKVAVGDVNGDGQDDLYICGARGQRKHIYLQKDGKFTPSVNPEIGRFIGFEDTAARFFDADGDGDLDLYVGSGGNYAAVGERENQDRLFFNDGKGNFAMQANTLPSNGFNTAVIAPHDYDGDGDLDLFVGSRSTPLQYGFPPKSYLYQNNGRGQFTDATPSVSAQLQNIGMVTDAKWTDLDGDKKAELVVVGEWMQPTVFSYQKDKMTVKNADNFKKMNGFWYSVAISDLDGDGDNDMILGNVGANCYLSDRGEVPLKLWLNDFDGNGYVEKFMTYQISEKDLPVNMKKEMVKELPILKKQVLKHHDYAKKSFQDLFPKEKTAKAVVKQVDIFKSVIAINDGKGNFTFQDLPTEIQLSSVAAIQILDINKDNLPDIVLGGNHFGYLPQYGRNDASFGNVLLNKGKMNFDVLKNAQSGLMVKGMLRDIQPLKIKGANYLIMAVNNEKPQFYKW